MAMWRTAVGGFTGTPKPPALQCARLGGDRGEVNVAHHVHFRAESTLGGVEVGNDRGERSD